MSKPVAGIQYKRIVAPVDGSEASKRAAEQAIHIAKIDGASLTFLHVVEDIKEGGVISLREKFGDVSLVEAYKNARIEAANNVIDPLLKSAAGAGINAEKEIMIAGGESEAGAIIKHAEENKADLIVIGAKGYSKFERIFVGSVTSSIVNAAKCQVLIVR